MREIAAGHGRTFDDIDSVRGWLARRDRCTGKIGVIGFCMGGAYAVALAPGHGYAAARVNYGGCPKDAEQALAGACPIVGSYGGRDRSPIPGRHRQPAAAVAAARRPRHQRRRDQVTVRPVLRRRRPAAEGRAAGRLPPGPQRRIRRPDNVTDRVRHLGRQQPITPASCSTSSAARHQSRPRPQPRAERRVYTSTRRTGRPAVAPWHAVVLSLYRLAWLPQRLPARQREPSATVLAVPFAGSRHGPPGLCWALFLGMPPGGRDEHHQVGDPLAIRGPSAMRSPVICCLSAVASVASESASVFAQPRAADLEPVGSKPMSNCLSSRNRPQKPRRQHFRR
jgi:Dienelactone hydrolase family